MRVWKVWLALLVLVGGWIAWPYLWHGAFYHAIALGIFLLFWEWKQAGTVYEIGFWLAVSNGVDEIFFDPTKFGWNEVAFAVIIIYFATNKQKRKCRTAKQIQRL